MIKKIENLRIILGDQLSTQISSLQGMNQNDVILMMEVADETCYVPHHPQKIIFILSAMRHFAAMLEKQWQVEYIELDSKKSRASFTDTLAEQLKHTKPKKIIITMPGEYRVLEMINQWQAQFDIEVELREDDRYFCSLEQFNQWAKGRKQYRMENFYRMLRQQTGILMEADEPVGGTWNFDKQNRQTLPDNISLPQIKTFKPDTVTQEVIALVKRRFKQHFGEAEPFVYGVTRRQALMALKDFIEHRLERFGDYQDAMKLDEHTLYHSLLSQYLNVGLLLPEEVCFAAERAYDEGHAPINAVEGFIRQILGWREYMRGIYWYHMPDYEQSNFFNAQHDLPAFYWTGKTDMVCMSHVVKQTQQTAQSHHIQRLMVTGNFALLYGVEPKQICAWYLAVYIDAFDWVELPNTHGMSMFADGGIVASKPYAASGKYIHKMSNFCKNCRYDVKQRSTEDACPFNVLYWDFLLKHEQKLKDNSRMKLMLSHCKNISESEKSAIKKYAKIIRNPDS